MPRVKKKPVAYDDMTLADVATAFHVGVRSVYKWVEAGCPRNENQSLCFYSVHSWLLEQESNGKSASDKLETKKLKEQIRKLENENDRNEDKYMLRTDHEAVLCSRASSLRNFLERGLSQNRAHRVMRTLDELISIDFDLTSKMMDAWTGGQST